MDEDQKFAFDLANRYHNLVISGQAGCGKTFLVKQIVISQRKNGQKVSIVCSTGIASTHYGELGAQTLHKWGGIEDGRHLNEELVHLVKTDERFMQVKDNILSTDLLIIDEVSMISCKLLGQLEFLCRKIRNNDIYFGGIQIILVGDFYQLPPVANELIGDPGHHCFRLSWFDNCFPHKIRLNIIHRQSETDLITCVNELEVGNPSDNTLGFINSLNRPIENEQASVQLFARNLDVDLFNYNKLTRLPGEMKVFKSVDEGSEHYLNKFLAPKNLGLKVGCPVMLVKNLTSKLVNGLRGTVTKLGNDTADVNFKFESRSVTVTVKCETFQIFDPVKKSVLAKRVQLPLKVAYAITIHKSQGMSFKSVVVNCENCFQPGQIGVAVGRAETVAGLKIVNFRKSLCRKHSSHVTIFYENFSVGVIEDDLSCCRYKKITAAVSRDDDDDDDDLKENTTNESSPEFSDSEFSDSEIDYLEFADFFITETESKSPSKFMLDSAFDEFVNTPMEKEFLEFKTLILKNYGHYNNWYDNQVSMVEDIGLYCFPEGSTTFSPKQQNDFFVKFNRYLTSEEYKDSATTLLNALGTEKHSQHFKFLTTLLFDIERKYFQSFTCHLNLQPPESIKSIPVSADLSAPARGKIRYISGYAIAKCKYSISKRIRQSLFVPGKEKELSKLQNQMTLLNSVCISYDDLKNISNDPNSLSEIMRKQNERESLINITDACFHFFTKLEILCREKITHLSLSEQRKNLFNHVKEELLKDSNLFNCWLKAFSTPTVGDDPSVEGEKIENIVSSMTEICENYIDLFNFVVNLFLKVSVSQFRRDYLTFLKKEKGKALRKKVKERSKKTLKAFSMQYLKEDKSVDKIASHLQLKAELLQNEHFLAESSLTKKDLLLLCKLYNKKISTTKKKNDISTELVSVILQNDSIPCPEVMCEVVAASSPHPSESANVDSNIDSEIPGPSHESNTPTSITTTSVTPASLDNPDSNVASSSSAVLEHQPAMKRKTSAKGKGRGKGKGKGKGKGRPKRQKTINDKDAENNENCAVCNAVYVDGEDWICCDICSLWFQRDCANLQDDEEWSHITEEGEIFTCPFCQ